MHAAILGATFFGAVVGNGAPGTVTPSFETARIDVVVDEPQHDRDSAALTQLNVALLGPSAVSVALDNDTHDLRASAQHRSNLLKQ